MCDGAFAPKKIIKRHDCIFQRKEKPSWPIPLPTLLYYHTFVVNSISPRNIAKNPRLPIRQKAPLSPLAPLRRFRLLIQRKNPTIFLSLFTRTMRIMQKLNTCQAPALFPAGRSIRYSIFEKSDDSFALHVKKRAGPARPARSSIRFAYTAHIHAPVPEEGIVFVTISYVPSSKKCT